jgi:hypothetical protein
MTNTDAEHLTYAHLARRGDPAAFYALFGGHIGSFYALLRSRGMGHDEACGGAARTAAALYGKFIRKRPGNCRNWFAAKCGLKGFSADGANVSAAELADCEKRVSAALNKAYSEMLNRGGDGKGNVVSGRPFLPYFAGLAAALALAAFLFFSESSVSVSVGRFGLKYELSFPKIADKLWSLSGLVRGGGADRRHAPNAPNTAPPAPAGSAGPASVPAGGDE